MCLFVKNSICNVYEHQCFSDLMEMQYCVERGGAGESPTSFLIEVRRYTL